MIITTFIRFQFDKWWFSIQIIRSHWGNSVCIRDSLVKNWKIMVGQYQVLVFLMGPKQWNIQKHFHSLWSNKIIIERILYKGNTKKKQTGKKRSKKDMNRKKIKKRGCGRRTNRAKEWDWNKEETDFVWMIWLDDVVYLPFVWPKQSHFLSFNSHWTCQIMQFYEGLSQSNCKITHQN